MKNFINWLIKKLGGFTQKDTNKIIAKSLKTLNQVQDELNASESTKEVLENSKLVTQEEHTILHKSDEKITYEKIRAVINEMKQYSKRNPIPQKTPYIILRESFVEEHLDFTTTKLPIEPVKQFQGCPALAIDDFDFNRILNSDVQFFLTYDKELFEQIQLLAIYYKQTKEA